MHKERTQLSTAAALLLIAAGCSSGDGEGGVFTRPEPTPYEPITGGDVEASMTAEELGAIVPDALALAMAFEPAAVLSAYQDLFALADADCPTVTSQGSASYWYGDCTTAAGTSFRGAVRLQLYVDTPEDGGTLNGFLLSSEGQPLEITAADGRWLRGAFYMESRTVEFPSESNFALYFAGEVNTDAVTAAGNTWLGGGVRGTLGRYAAQVDGGRYLGFGGSFTAAPAGPLAAAGVTAVSFDELALLDYGCLGVIGAVSVRDAKGAWHDTLFAPKVEDPPVAEVCDTCGAASFQSEPLGGFCSNETAFENIIYWDTTPW